MARRYYEMNCAVKCDVPNAAEIDDIELQIHTHTTEMIFNNPETNPFQPNLACAALLSVHAKCLRLIKSNFFHIT